MKNLNLPEGLHKLTARDLHRDYLGESVLVASDGENAVIGKLQSFRIRKKAPVANAEAGFEVRVRIGSQVLDIDGDHQIVFMERFQAIPYNAS